MAAMSVDIQVMIAAAVLYWIPMLKDLKIQSQRIPFDGIGWSVAVDMGNYIDSQIDCNTRENGRRLRESIGMSETEYRIDLCCPAGWQRFSFT